MSKFKFDNNQLKPILFAIVSFAFLVIATISYANYKKGQWEKDIRAKLLDMLISKKSKIEKALYSRIYYTRGVSAFVALKPDITNFEFYELAKEYIKNDTVIGTMALSKDCVINAIYPLEGHEAAIGLDLLKHPERKEIVEKTIETHQTFVAGPVELVEGGIAFISYTPIFEKLKQSESRFWGMTDIVINRNSLLNEARFLTPANGFEFALKGYNGLGENGSVFWGKEEVFDELPVKISIELPIGNWVLAGIPEGGWDKYPDQDKAISFILLFSSFIISILVWLFAKALIKLKNNEKELLAIFGSMDNTVGELNSEGYFIKIAPTNASGFFMDRDELLGKNLFEIFENSQAEYILNAVRKCLITNKLEVVEYRFNTESNEVWYSAQINYKTNKTVIFNSFDITERKMNSERLENSERKLIRLNELKDKLFSIIAHDLRNPVGGIKSLLELMVNDFEEISKTEFKEMLLNLKDSSENLHNLLEDLLDWSRSQSGKIVVNKQKHNLKLLVDGVLNQLETDANRKNITLLNEVVDEYEIFADQGLLIIVLRNLVSNAIKFTNRNGTVKVYGNSENLNGNIFYKVQVIDNGIGIEDKILNSLFTLDKIISSPGTENELGTGLGLLLCKELIEKQNGKISVKSEVKKGSVFTFMLPHEVNKS